MSDPPTSEPTLDELREALRQREARALAMGGAEKLAQRRALGVLNARERIARLFDPGSFLESGLLAHSIREADRERTPADGKITGYGRIEGRPAACVANDFTVLGASSSWVNGRKIRHLKQVAARRGLPIVWLGESTGARLPDVMGAEAMGMADDPAQYRRLRETPWAAAVLGHCYGSSAWYAAMSDFVVMRRGAILAVSSPKLTALATGEQLDPEALGGWKLHAEVTGLVDRVVDRDEEAIDAIKRFLSYLPSHSGEPPPVAERFEAPDADALARHLPTSRRRVYEVRKVLAAIFDRDSLFELKAGYGGALVTALARLNGHSVGVLASNPMVKGGAIDAAACGKATAFLVLCDSFNIPLVFMIDQPGFLIGVEGERRGMPGRVMNWMNALSLVTVPRLAVVMRKNYGQALLNFGGGGNADETLVWTTAEIGFMSPEFAARIVHGEPTDPDTERQRLEEMARSTSPYALAGIYAAQHVIDPRDTRALLLHLLEVHRRPRGGVGEHRLHNWPTSLA
ncbi:MAG TPA: carboxyl transferase domain-containing protein [Dehalococcoidia bacterium]|nr:carboxyl transferase domain-containing protein [Dehalococcoidia bacterium]